MVSLYYEYYDAVKYIYIRNMVQTAEAPRSGDKMDAVAYELDFVSSTFSFPSMRCPRDVPHSRSRARGRAHKANANAQSMGGTGTGSGLALRASFRADPFFDHTPPVQSYLFMFWWYFCLLCAAACWCSVQIAAHSSLRSWQVLRPQQTVLS